MKKLFWILLLLPIALFSCSGEDETEDEGDAISDVVLNSGDEWIETTSGVVFVINTQEELEQYIDSKSGSYPEIDFNRFSVLKVSHYSPKYIVRIGEPKLTNKNKANEYLFTADIIINIADEAPRYDVVVKCPKLGKEAIVEYQANFIFYGSEES